MSRGFQSKTIKKISCGEYHTAAITENGVLLTWGRGNNGRLGHGLEEDENFPKIVEGLTSQVLQVSCGDFHTACIVSSVTGVPMCLSWGLGGNGRLGHGDEIDRWLPTPIKSLEGVNIILIVCGGHHSAAITDDGSLLTWGGGAFGKLGTGDRLNRLTPTKIIVKNRVGNIHRVMQVALGVQHSACISEKGELYSWGHAGRLGHAPQGAESDVVVPQIVASLLNQQMVNVACGHSHTVAITETGDVWAWGTSRILGHTESSMVPNAPVPIKALAGIVQVSCGISHSLALSDLGRLVSRINSVTRRGALKPPPLQKRDEAVISKERLQPETDEKCTLGGLVMSGNPTDVPRVLSKFDRGDWPSEITLEEAKTAFLAAETMHYQKLSLELSRALETANRHKDEMYNDLMAAKEVIAKLEENSRRIDSLGSETAQTMEIAPNVTEE
eukprot:GHVL01027078.1.p1 GENE.GHVL01027078.1~~GHVL01027078.1.p1  ORF type:complete len:443 (+),score=86.39 GHVL01027078.1:258-1586(+)